MDNKYNVIVWGTAIIGVALLIAIVIFNDSEILLNVVGGLGILGLIGGLYGAYYKGLKRLYQKNKGIYKEKVRRKKPIPVYYSFQTAMWAGVLVLLYGTFIYVTMHYKINEILSHSISCLILVGVIILIAEFWQNRVLYLCKNDMNVVEYNKNIKDFGKVAGMRSYLSFGHFVNRICECVKLDNGIEFWQCYAQHHSSSVGSRSSTYYYNYIFAITQYESDNNMNLLLTNSLEKYLSAENLYISKYSNLPPFVISNENDENICKDIEKLCSDFFARTRSTYVLMIEAERISLGLNSARFGKFNSIFNKKRKKELTEEAMHEISEFLLQIKNVIEEK